MDSDTICSCDLPNYQCDYNYAGECECGLSSPAGCSVLYMTRVHSCPSTAWSQYKIAAWLCWPADIISSPVNNVPICRHPSLLGTPLPVLCLQPCHNDRRWSVKCGAILLSNSNWQYIRAVLWTRVAPSSPALSMWHFPSSNAEAAASRDAGGFVGCFAARSTVVIRHQNPVTAELKTLTDVRIGDVVVVRSQA